MGLFTSISKDIKKQFAYGNMVNQLIIVNVVVFVAVNVVGGIMRVSGLSVETSFSSFLEWIAMPYDINKLIFRPWTIFTYNFLHVGFFHILWNMLFLYWFGRIIQDFLGARRILPIYVYGGLAGGIISFLVSPLLGVPTSAVLLGASAGVTAIVLATATLRPDYEFHLIFLGPVKIMYIALFRIVMDIIAISNFNNIGGSVAHLGGALFGYLFIRQLQEGNDWSVGFNKLADRIADVFRGRSIRPTKLKAKRGGRSSRRKWKDPKMYDPNTKQDRVDEILDKIARSGYESLSKEEKEFLFKVSNEK